MKNITIETPRLVLRAWKKEDVDDLYEWLKDLDVAKNLTVPYPYTRDHAEQFILNHLYHNKESYSFAIVLKSTNKVIGGTSLDFNKDLKQYKGGIWFNKKYIGKGFGTEAFSARAEFAFNYLNLQELNNGYFEWNEKSFNMQQKLGYKKIGTKTTFCPTLNKDVVEVLTRLNKSDYIKRH